MRVQSDEKVRNFIGKESKTSFSKSVSVFRLIYLGQCLYFKEIEIISSLKPYFGHYQFKMIKTTLILITQVEKEIVSDIFFGDHFRIDDGEGTQARQNQTFQRFASEEKKCALIHLSLDFTIFFVQHAFYCTITV